MTAVNWVIARYNDLVHALPAWLSIVIAVAVALLLVVIVMRICSRILFRIIGLVLSAGFGISAHLLLHPALTWVLERYTAWRAG